MKKSLLVAVAAFTFTATQVGWAQVAATANGGAGGAGGSAAGGTANGGTATNTSTTTGTSSANGGTANIGTAASNIQGSEVSVNYTTPAGAAGINGLAPGVDPTNNHIVSDNNVRYSGTTRIKNTPDVNIGGPASGPCNGASGGLGVGIPGLAVGANIATVDKGCEAREAARVAAMIGRIDVANAILENMDVVVAALKAKAERDLRAQADVDRVAAQARGADNANRAIVSAVQQRAADDAQAARDRESNTMRALQQAGTEALQRNATMSKVNETLSFTGARTQGDEKTPQQLMAEELVARQAADRKAAETQAAERLIAERAAADKVAADKLAADKLAAEKLALDTAAAERSVAEKVAAEQRAADRLAEQRVADRRALEQATAQRAAEVASAKREDERTAASKSALGGPAAGAKPAPLMAAAKQEAARPTAPQPASAGDRKPSPLKDGPNDGDAVRFALGLGS